VTTEQRASSPSPVQSERYVRGPWWDHGLIFGLIRLRSPTFIGVRINAAMQVADVNGIRRTIIQTSENRKVALGTFPLPSPDRTTLVSCWSWDNHPGLYSGKHHTTGLNIQIVCDLAGRLRWISGWLRLLARNTCTAPEPRACNGRAIGRWPSPHRSRGARGWFGRRSPRSEEEPGSRPGRCAFAHGRWAVMELRKLRSQLTGE
jgi:hypothetical protein